jgi:hypothetical protein
MACISSEANLVRSDVGQYDRVVIQDILKEIAQTQQIDTNAKQKFKGKSSTSQSHEKCTDEVMGNSGDHQRGRSTLTRCTSSTA